VFVKSGATDDEVAANEALKLKHGIATVRLHRDGKEHLTVVDFYSAGFVFDQPATQWIKGRPKKHFHALGHSSDANELWVMLVGFSSL
jgi:hypothetical protein